MSGSAQFDTPHSRLLLPATLTWGDTKKKMVTLKAFVDSGAPDNFWILNWQIICVSPMRLVLHPGRLKPWMAELLGLE